MSETQSTSEVTTPIFVVPEQIFEADLWTNQRFPQSFLVKTVMVGAAAMDLIKTGQYNWREFVQAQMSSDQVKRSKDSVYAAHKAYGIPFMPAEHSKESTVRTIEDSELIGVLRHTMDNVTRTSGYYARWVLKEHLFTNVREAAELWGEEWINDPESEIVRELTILSTDPGYQKEFHGLCQLWETSAELLRTPRVMTIGTELRNGIGQLYKAKDKEDEIARLRPYWDGLTSKLDTLISNNLTDQCTRIEEGTGRKMPDYVSREITSTRGYSAYILPQHQEREARSRGS